ncbi:GL22658 [Drosophila persimilis]|uniref:GL22658 n=1 Tax=Drosophila persimilis TaxID=7234 RepID=B4H048_DROPE|nr:GL22658 [Drosophila persimilis]
MESHASAEGFCLCHLMSVWHTIGRIGLYLGYYNVGYAEQRRRFVGDEQLYVHLMGARESAGQPGLPLAESALDVRAVCVPAVCAAVRVLPAAAAPPHGAVERVCDDPQEDPAGARGTVLSWRLLQHRTLPQAFGVTLMRRRQHLRRNQDIVTTMFSTNFAATQLVPHPLLLASVGCKAFSLALTLATFRTLLVSHLRELLLLLVLRLLLHKHFNSDESGEGEGPFDDDSNGNVTQTISQVYRFYFYDEFE